MTTRRRDSATLDLFESPRPVPARGGSLNFDREIRHLLSRMIKESPCEDRYEVAARMSRYLGEEVTKYQLDSWTAESRRPWRFPFEYAAAIEAACESHALSEFLAEKRGGIVLWGEDALNAELGKLDILEAEIKRRKRGLKQRLEERR